MPASRFRASRYVSDTNVLVIGTGIGRIQLGATLRQNGIDDFLMVDVARDFGGTWYWKPLP